MLLIAGCGLALFGVTQQQSTEGLRLVGEGFRFFVLIVIAATAGSVITIAIVALLIQLSG